MNIKKVVLALVMIFVSSLTFAQSSIDDLVKEGIQHHDNGDFQKAIASYEKALEISPKSALVNYEIALSYFSLGDYKKSIKYSDKVLKQKKDYMIQAYMTKGSALDQLGKTEKSIKLFKKAIKEVGEHHLLYYNLALNYYKLDDLENAEKNTMKAIENNSNHPSSHLMLANIHHIENNTAKTLMAFHYFLFLEPNSKRSSEAFHKLHENFNGNVTKDANKPNTINISFSSDDDNPFAPAELMISMLSAANMGEENQDKTEDELFIDNTKTFFKMLGELPNETEEWWSFYTSFFYDLASSDHLETYCKYITQSENENSRKWLDENEAKIAEFGEWLQNN